MRATDVLGAQATEPLSGVYNPARLFRFLCIAEMDVRDARNQIVLNFNARVEFELDAKRERIVREDLSFNTLPRMLEYIRYQPFNPFLGRAKDGRAVSYLNFGDKSDFEGLKKAFTVDEYMDGGYREGREGWDVMSKSCAPREKEGERERERDHAMYSLLFN